ncbi:MAG: prolipoprotein diacylglyceryl transferase [Elusimicrobiota bacterium]
MYPILLKLGSVTFYTYGLFYAIGLMVAAWVVLVQTRKDKVDDNLVYDLIFCIILGILIGARIFYVIMNLGYYLKEPLKVLALWEGGLYFHGGLIGGILAGVVFALIKKISIFEYFDYFAPAVAVGHAMGRIGCFFAGCCYGKPTGFFMHIVFTNENSLAPTGIPLHPAQVYSAIGDFCIFLALWLRRGKKRYKGQLLIEYLMMFSCFRYFIEFLRGDDRGVGIAGLSVTQVVSVVVFAVALVISVYMTKKIVKPQKDLRQ